MKRPVSPSLRPPSPDRATPPAKEPKRSSIRHFFAPGRADSPPPRAPPRKPPVEDAVCCVDLFCGAGGWSCGAEQAGHRVVLGVDFDKEILKIHRRNFPDARHCVMKLGKDCEERLVSLIHECVPEGARWCLHGSPPCQTLSTMQNVRGDGERRSVGMDLVTWFLALVMRLKPTYWSLEQCAHPEIMGALRFYKALDPGGVDFGRVDFSYFGVCQRRIRVLAGSPALLTRFLNDDTVRENAPDLSDILSVPDDAFYQRASVGKNPKTEQNVQMPDGSFTNPTIRRDVRSVHTLSWTCTAHHPHVFLRKDFSVIRHQTPRETALIQSFPPAFKFVPSASNTVHQLGMGNALPPLIARKLMEGVSAAKASCSAGPPPSPCA